MAEAESKAGVQTATGRDESIDRAFDEAMDDDFNTAKALADLFALFRTAGAKAARQATSRARTTILGQVKKTYSLLGLFRAEPAEDFVEKCEAKHRASVPADSRPPS